MFDGERERLGFVVCCCSVYEVVVRLASVVEGDSRSIVKGLSERRMRLKGEIGEIGVGAVVGVRLGELHDLVLYSFYKRAVKFGVSLIK